ncbi:MAG TPA: ferrous iron transport protein A, partial [Candidatus Sellimonas avistercoris]|nr:ferrous iron transport protein A [Candidatus Sellimonas avistercoris]
MQPLIFLQQGDKAWIKRVGGAEETKRFLAGLGFVENAEVSVI